STGEDCIAKLRDIIENDLQLQSNIENAHRIGPFKDDGTPRPILAKFLYRPERFRVIKKKRDLRDGVRVSDDLIWEDRQKKKQLRSKKCILMGDTNINTLTKTSVSKEYINLIQSEGFSQLIFEATRITENSQSCIDHIFTNISTSCSSGSLAVEIADHLPVFTILYDPKFSPFPDYFEFRDFRSFEDENFKLDLRRESWDSIYKCNEVNESYTSVYYSLIYPYLTYACTLWGNNYNAPLSQIVKLQNKAVRVINDVPLMESITPHYTSLGLLKFPDIVKLNT
ncbi:unnamed protein product, partial [Porites evermanni]